MMSKVFVFVAFLCAVNAYVAVNIYDTDVETSRLSDLSHCDAQHCSQTCHRIGFPGGVCVGDTCKCDINKPEDNEIPAAEPEVVASNNVVKAEAALAQPEAPRTCYSWQCTNICRAAGYLGGYCIFESCTCY